MVFIVLMACPTCGDGGEQPTGKPESSIGSDRSKPVGTKGEHKPKVPHDAFRYVGGDDFDY